MKQCNCVCILTAICYRPGNCGCLFMVTWERLIYFLKFKIFIYNRGDFLSEWIYLKKWIYFCVENWAIRDERDSEGTVFVLFSEICTTRARFSLFKCDAIRKCYLVGPHFSSTVSYNWHLSFFPTKRQFKI